MNHVVYYSSVDNVPLVTTAHVGTPVVTVIKIKQIHMYLSQSKTNIAVLILFSLVVRCLPEAKHIAYVVICMAIR